MPNFKYVVANKDNKQLIGKIEAESEEIARTELNELGFSIISLEEYAPEKEEAENKAKVFEFEGIDKKNTLIHGTIESEERYKAFNRLLKEYELDVSYIFDTTLPEEEQIKQKKAGVSDLLKQYQEEVQKNMKLYHQKKIKSIDRDFENKKALIMRQIDFIINKVNKFLDKYKNDLNPQDTQQIKSYINKVLRLKNTTNLEYLKTTCKSLLKFLQEAELFLNKKRRLKTKAKLYADAQDMMNHLEKGEDFGIYEDLEDQIKRWQNEHINNKEKISIQDKFKNFYYTIVLSAISEDPELKRIKKKIYDVNNELKQYYNLILKSKDKSYKKEAQASIKKLNEKKKKLKLELKRIKTEIKESKGASFFEKSLIALKTISGYVLLFCIIYFFAAAYISSKNILFTSPPLYFDVDKLYSFQHLFAASFLIYVLLSLKSLFFPKKPIATIIILPVLLLSLSIMVFNL